jgi:hypothetical protein
VVELETEHPLASVIFTVYISAGTFDRVELFCANTELVFCHPYAYGGVPPVAITEAIPFENPKHETGVEFICEVIIVGCVMV